MSLYQPVSPRKSLNKAYLKVKPNRIQIEAFKGNLIQLLDHINDSEYGNVDPAADTTDLEAEIDLMVYKLYNLPWEEVKIVDPEFGLSEEEYEKYRFE